MSFGGVFVPGSDLQAFQTLLTIVADPVAAQKRLEELRVSTVAYQKVVDKAQAEQAEAKRLKDEVQTAHAVATDLGTRNAVLRNTLMSREREVKRREDLVTAREHAHDQHVSDTIAQFGERERAVGQREQVVAARETDASNRAKSLASAEQEHERRVAKLKAAVE